MVGGGIPGVFFLQRGICMDRKKYLEEIEAVIQRGPFKA